MKKLTAALKVILFITFTIGNYLYFGISYYVVKLFDGKYRSWRGRCLSFWGRHSVKILGMKIETEGSPPKPPFFLVSNHLSYMDIPVYYSLLKTTFVAKSEIKNWPVVGWMARTLGIIFIDRNNRFDVHRVNTLISNKINKYQGVVLFPEGRTSPGKEILGFKAGLLQQPVEANFDVHYAVIHYKTGEEDTPAQDSVCWWQDFGLLKHFIGLASNRSIIAQVTFGKKSIRHDDRKVLAKKLHEESMKIFTSVSAM